VPEISCGDHYEAVSTFNARCRAKPGVGDICFRADAATESKYEPAELDLDPGGNASGEWGRTFVRIVASSTTGDCRR
jgi:hypothetical protein